MRIKEIENKEAWERFLAGCSEKTFLHSWNWGTFQEKLGSKVWRWGIYSASELVGVALVLKVKSKRGTFLFVPHGPIVKGPKAETLEVLLQELRNLGTGERARFIRIAPLWSRDKAHGDIFEDLGFRQAVLHTHPEVTWELDITPSSEELLSAMRKTTRYLIRQAERNKDLRIVQSIRADDIKLFETIYRETALRHTFVPFSHTYLESQFSIFQQNNEIALFLAQYQGKVIAAALVVFWQKSAFYHHGASLSQYARIPATYLLQWEAIKEAQKRGCRMYNFWGIAPDIKDKADIAKSKHPWAGLTLFKMGFGGVRKEYVQTQDFPLSPTYYLTYLFEKMRKARRRL